MAKTICFFNHKGGVSKTTTSFNLGWVLADKGYRVMLVDLDSQCNLTGLVLGYNAIDDDHMASFYDSRENITMRPIVDALIDGVQPPHYIDQEKGSLTKTKNDKLFLLPGSLNVADLDSQISVALRIALGVPATRNIPGNLPTILMEIAKRENIDYVLYDLSPNVGGLNEVILMSSDYFVVPTSPDYFCLQAIGSLTKNIEKWYKEINRFIEDNSFQKNRFSIKNRPQFIGTIQQRYRPRCEQPTKSFQGWVDEIRKEVNKTLVPSLQKIDCVTPLEKMQEILADSGLLAYDIANIPDFNSLIAISQRLSKPIFSLTDEEIKKEGKVFGHAQNTMQISRDNFNEIFSGLGDRVISLTKQVAPIN